MSIRNNLKKIKERIKIAAEKADRDPDGVTLVSVSKLQPLDAIREVYDEGQRHFGESKFQEALPKIQALPDDIIWHFIGTLQSNKARKVAQHFDVVHTLCTPSQLLEAEKAQVPFSALIEVNIASEPQKAGIFPAQLDEYHRNLLQSDNARFRGLMTIGPAVSEAEQMRPFFREIKRLGDQLGAEWLSMGMSNDFEVAIQEGASHVRIGTAIFGSR